MICVWTLVAVKGEKKPVALATVDGGPVKKIIAIPRTFVLFIILYLKKTTSQK